MVASRSHGDAEALDKFLDGRKVRSLKSAGSSLKICLVATGEADLYPRLGRTMSGISRRVTRYWPPPAGRFSHWPVMRWVMASPVWTTRISMRVVFSP